MRVLILSWNFPPTAGGIEDVMGNLFDGLRGRGHDVEVITGRAGAVPDAEGVNRVSAGGLTHYLWRSLGTAHRRARAWRPDVVVCGTLVTAPAAWWLRIRFGAPSVVLVHGTDIIRGGRLYRWLARFVLRRATHVTANSANTARLLADAGIPTRCVTVVPPGVRADRFTPAALHAPSVALADIGPERRVLLTVGRLIRRKGVLEFVEQAMPRIVQRVPEALLLVVGDDPTASLAHRGERLRERIAAAVRTHGLEHHVRLLGGVAAADLLSAYGRADLFVLPCLDVPGDVEGFGIVFLEAALGGAPAVATRVGGIPEAVVDQHTGVLAAPGDHAALADAVIELLTDGPRRQALATAAADRARTEYDWPVIVERYETVIRRIHTERPSA